MLQDRKTGRYIIFGFTVKVFFLNTQDKSWQKSRKFYIECGGKTSIVNNDHLSAD
jgi:hypothetical protein